jgi:molybdopterin-guanine dinucleotide biosynthesis protein
MPILIGIGGAGSGAGKTALGELLIKELPHWGLIKEAHDGIYTSVIDDEDVLREEGKDTARYLSSGAEKALLVRSPGGPDLEEALHLATARLSDLDGIIIEGNSAIELLKPDIVIFISGKYIKNSAFRVLEMAQVVLEEEKHEEKGNKKALFFSQRKECAQYVLGLVKALRMSNEIKKILTEKAKEGRITCPEARAIAESLGVPYASVGKAANELKIKIKNCELGCF